MAPDKKIFISHASRDAELAKALVDTMVLGGVGRDNIFFSSQRGMGIRAGGSVDDVLRNSLSSANLVIELITETFMTRPVCLMELGGAWALKIPTFPIVVPPLAHQDVTTKIGNFQMTSWGDETKIRDCFAELQDIIAADTGIDLKSSYWRNAVDDFVNKIRQLLVPDLKSTSPANPSTPPAPTTARSSPPAVASTPQKGIGFGRHSVTRSGGRPRLHVEATNHFNETKSAIIKATFYDNNDSIIDSSSTSLNDIEPGTTRTLTFLNVPTFERVKFDVDLML